MAGGREFRADPINSLQAPTCLLPCLRVHQTQALTLRHGLAGPASLCDPGLDTQPGWVPLSLQRLSVPPAETGVWVDGGSEKVVCELQGRTLLLSSKYPGGGASQEALVVKNPPASAGDIKDAGSIPGSGRPPGVGHGNPLQYCYLENPMDGGAWWATVHEVRKGPKSRTRLKRLSTLVGAWEGRGAQKIVFNSQGTSCCPTLRTRAGAKLGEWAGTGGREHPQRVARGGCEPGSWWLTGGVSLESAIGGKRKKVSCSVMSDSL